MPKRAVPPLATLSFRTPSATTRWLASLADKRHESQNTVVGRFIDDARNLYSLPPLLRDELVAEAERHQLSQREYISTLLTRRYEAIIRQAPRSKATGT